MLSLCASSDSLSLLASLKLPTWASPSWAIHMHCWTRCILFALTSAQLSTFPAFWPSILQCCQVSGSNAQEVCWRIPLALGSSWMWGLAFLGQLDSFQAAELISSLGYVSTKQPVDLEFHWCGEHRQPTLTMLRTAAAPKPASWSASPGGGAG